jgi:hypothetical protein
MIMQHDSAPRITGLFAIVAALAACSDQPLSPPAPLPPGAVDPTCVDDDGDGFGAGCAAGDDCGDDDPESTDECYRCDEPAPGCPCDVDGQKYACEMVHSTVGEQEVCGPGVSVCEQGVWSECVLNYTVPASGGYLP